MAKYLTLESWADMHYESPKPTLQTLQRWARKGNIYPAPEKHGSQYRVQPGAIYINPTDKSLGKKIRDVGGVKTTKSEFMEKVINGTPGSKV